MVRLVTKKEAPVSPFAAPVQAIAALFHNPVIRRAGEDGEEVLTGMASTQMMVLAGIARTVCYQLNLTKDKLDQALKDVARLQREHRGDEISENKLNRACDWVEQLEMQEATLTDMLRETKAVYALHTGKEFVEPEPKLPPRKVPTSDAMARAARFTKLDPSLMNTNGVETQD